MGASAWPFPGISEDGPRLRVQLEPGSDPAGALGKALHEIQHGCKHLDIDLSGLELKVTSGSVVAKILSSEGPLETLAISNGTLVMEVVSFVTVATALKDVNIRVPRRPVLGQHQLQKLLASYGNLAPLTHVVAPIYAFKHVSLTNVQLVCSKAAALARGIIWMPDKKVQGKDRPVFSATASTIEGFQNALLLESPGFIPLQAYLTDCKLTQLLQPAASVNDHDWYLVEVDDRIELVIQGCTLQGAPAAPKHPDDLCLGGLMYIGSYSSVSITGSRLICLYNPLVKWQSMTGCGISLAPDASLTMAQCELYGVSPHTRNTSTNVTITSCQLLDALSPEGVLDPGPPSRVQVAGGLSMTQVKVKSSSMVPVALIRCGPLVQTDVPLASEVSKLKAELMEVTVVAKGGRALQVQWLKAHCSGCSFSDCKDTPEIEAQMVVDVRNQGRLVLDDCKVSCCTASRRQEKCLAVCAQEGARAIMKRSVIKATGTALAALPDATVAVSETELEGSHYAPDAALPHYTTLLQAHPNASMLLDKCTLRARWGWALLLPGGRAQLRSCVLIRPEQAQALYKWAAVKVEVPTWELVGNCPASDECVIITADMFPPGSKQQLLENQASQAARGGGEAVTTSAPSSSPAATSSSVAGSADTGAGSQQQPEVKHVCAACGAKREDAGVTLQLCSGCCAVRYCSSECQHADWKAHKAACKAKRVERDQALNLSLQHLFIKFE